MDFLDNLNDEQREAVLQSGGPLLILAGAGSGKTRVIAYRVAYLIGAGHADPREVVAVTFTNKAAEEMQGRAAAAPRGAGDRVVPRLRDLRLVRPGVGDEAGDARAGGGRQPRPAPRGPE